MGIFVTPPNPRMDITTLLARSDHPANIPAIDEPIDSGAVFAKCSHCNGFDTGGLSLVSLPLLYDCQGFSSRWSSAS
jgi:hypothetical protein